MSYSEGSIRKTTSLQSAVAVRIDPEIEKLQKEFDKYKAEKKSETDLLSRQCEMTFSENRRLRGELKMIQATCSKLKQERDRAQMAEKDAVQRSSAIESGIIHMILPLLCISLLESLGLFKIPLVFFTRKKAKANSFFQTK